MGWGWDDMLVASLDGFIAGGRGGVFCFALDPFNVPFSMSCVRRLVPCLVHSFSPENVVLPSSPGLAPLPCVTFARQGKVYEPVRGTEARWHNEDRPSGRQLATL
jgi:hypothetical protein